jgi:hypothetical protein
MWFFTVFHSNSRFRNAAWDTIISHGRFTVGYYSISRVTRGHHALKQYGVRELLFVLNFVQKIYWFKLTKDFKDVCYLQWSKGYMLKYFKEKMSKTQVCISFEVCCELSGFFNFRYNISFIDPPLGRFVEILPSVMIFPWKYYHSG